MIIKRRYATVGQICTDETTKNAICEIFDAHNVPEDIRVFVFDPYSSVMISNSNMSMFMSKSVYKEVMEKLEELDKTDPFDNLLNYKNVDKVLTIPGKKGGALMQIMYSKQPDLPTRVVQVLAFETKEGKTELIEPWEVDNVALV